MLGPIKMPNCNNQHHHHSIAKQFYACFMSVKISLKKHRLYTKVVYFLRLFLVNRKALTILQNIAGLKNVVAIEKSAANNLVVENAQKESRNFA